jgi:sugar phosphate isomerase/epimerase
VYRLQATRAHAQEVERGAVNMGGPDGCRLHERRSTMAKIGVIHYNFPQFDFEQFLDYCPGAGFSFVEVAISDIWGNGVTNPEAEAEKVLGKLQARGLQASALAAGNDFVVLEEGEIAEQVERMKRICGLAKILGTSVIRTEGGQPKDSVPEEKWVDAIAGCFKRLAEFGEANGIKFAMDNHGWCTNDGDRQLAIIQAVGSPCVGVNLDTMNYRWFGHSVPEINRFYAMLAKHTFHTHMKDGTGSRGEYVGAALGEGEIDLACAVKCLHEVGYDGVWCAEYEGQEPTDIGYKKCADWMHANI